MMHPLTKVKISQKEKAQKIRDFKFCRKAKNRVENPALQNLFDNAWKLFSISWEYRHVHIAYCEIRGRERSQIEIPREDNLPNEDKISKIKDSILKEIEEHEALRSSS
jgi:hypothetical protein